MTQLAQGRKAGVTAELAVFVGDSAVAPRMDGRLLNISFLSSRCHGEQRGFSFSVKILHLFYFDLIYCTEQAF